MQRFIRSSAAEAHEMLQATKIDGKKWQSPVISKRRAKILRTKALEEKTFGSWTPGKGGWLPEWDTQAKVMIMKPPKGHLNARNKDDRIAKIQAGLAAQPKKLEEMKKLNPKKLTGWAKVLLGNNAADV